jgi:hypothetical protein
MSSYDVSPQFGTLHDSAPVYALPDLVIAPFHVLQHFTSIEKQLSVFALARRVLRAGGRFVLDVFNPAYPMMIGDRSAEVEDVAERPLGDGRTVRRTVRVTAVHWARQVSDVELIYHVRTGDRTERVVQAFAMRWFTPAELEHLVARGRVPARGDVRWVRSPGADGRVAGDRRRCRRLINRPT